GTKASSMKQLTGNRYVAEFAERARRRSRAASGAKGAAGTKGAAGAKGATERAGGSSVAGKPEASRRVRSGPTDPWDARYTGNKVNWDHDLEVDPPPF